LVSWSYPSPEVQRRARAEGVEMRVHPVGPPPRLAESSWLAHASAAIVSDGPAISSALLLRVLASGCPLVWVRPTGPAERVARWLDDRDCVRVADGDAEAIEQTLGTVLERGPAIEAMIEQGRALAARHDGSALSERLAGSLGAPRTHRRAA